MSHSGCLKWPSTAKHKKQQPQAVSDKAMPERMEKHCSPRAKPVCALWARAPAWATVLKSMELKLRGQGKQAHVIVGS